MKRFYNIHVDPHFFWLTFFPFAGGLHWHDNLLLSLTIYKLTADLLIVKLGTSLCLSFQFEINPGIWREGKINNG